MFSNRGDLALASVAIAAIALACAPALSSSPKFSVRTKQNAPSIRMSSIGSFTPAAADARRALSLGRAGLAGNGFRFTPSSEPGSRRAVTVAIRARAGTSAVAERGVSASGSMAGLAPTAYNLGVAVGWRRFAITGDVARVDGGLLPVDRELADLGFSYSGNKWSTRLQLGAERSIGARSGLIGADESYSVDLGGSYSLTGNLEVTGGLRYKMQHDRLQPLMDSRRDSQAVYVGTAFRF